MKRERCNHERLNTQRNDSTTVQTDQLLQHNSCRATMKMPLPQYMHLKKKITTNISKLSTKIKKINSYLIIIMGNNKTCTSLSPVTNCATDCPSKRLFMCFITLSPENISSASWTTSRGKSDWSTGNEASEDRDGNETSSASPSIKNSAVALGRLKRLPRCTPFQDAPSWMENWKSKKYLKESQIA